MSSLPAWPMITSEVLIWLNRIKRWISANPKASNPWTIEVKRDLPQEILSFSEVCAGWGVSGGQSD